jgi:hypothetical protein
LPFACFFYLSSNFALGFAALIISYLFSSSYLGPTFALLQEQAPVKMRAVWAAITLLVINLIGLGIGPTAVGIISDLLKPTFGTESLRYAMLSIELATPWAIFHYWRAGVLMKRMQANGATG